MALLCVAYSTAVSPEVITSFYKAEKAYTNNNMPLAQMHLAMTGLPAIDLHSTPERLFMAEHLLKWGVAPCELLNCIGIDSRSQDEEAKVLLKFISKFNPYHRGPGPGGGQFTTAGEAGGEYQVASDDGTPGNNQAQNKQFKDAVRTLGLTKDQAQLLHRKISGQNFGYHDILDEGRDMFDK